MPNPTNPDPQCVHCEVPIGPTSGNAPEEGCTCADVRCRWCCNCYQCTGCTTRAGAPVRHTGGTGALLANGRGRENDRCVGCGTCRSHCACPACSQCGTIRTADDRCGTCGRGAGCCGTCRCSRGWEFFRPEETRFWNGRRGKLIPSLRLASLEIETDAHSANPPGSTAPKLMEVARKWSAALVEDGSVGAFEVNTAPASGHYLEQQLSDFGQAFVAGKTRAGAGCGVHVHVDTRDFHYWDIRRLALLWRATEGGFYALADPSRETNRYCLPCGESYAAIVLPAKTTAQLKSALLRNIYEKNAGKAFHRKVVAAGSKYQGKRYNALNLHSWFYRGTVENRIHHGTVREETLRNWALLNIALVDCAYAWPEPRIQALHKGGRHDKAAGLKALLAVAETVGLDKWAKARAAEAARGGFKP